MKRKLQFILLLLIAGGCGLFLYRYCFPDHEKLIRQNLASLAKIASFPKRPTTTANLAAGDRLRNLLSADITLEVDVPLEGRQTLAGRPEIIQAVLAARANFNGLKVQFLDVSVLVDPAGQTATAELTARATQPGEREFFVQQIKFTLKNEDRHWRFSRIETIKTLKL